MTDELRTAHAKLSEVLDALLREGTKRPSGSRSAGLALDLLTHVVACDSVLSRHLGESPWEPDERPGPVEFVKGFRGADLAYGSDDRPGPVEVKGIS